MRPPRTRGRDDTAPQAEFRTEARRWLEAHAPLRGQSDTLSVPFGPEDESGIIAAAKRWQAVLYDGHWAGITWPREHGGRGATVAEQVIFDEEASAFDLPATGIFTIGIGMVGPTLIRHGTLAQKDRYLRGILRGNEVWCQLFSEPGAGSDLASLSTRAERDGNGWVVNGQKVWTSGAHYRDFGLLLARTSPDRHRGLTCFIVDMHTEGVEVRPLRQMTGGASFNEVFLTDLRLPPDALVGDVDHGWQVAITTLANERVALGGGADGSAFRNLVALAQNRGCTLDPVMRQRLADVFIRGEIVRFLALRVRTEVLRGGVPGPQGSIAKLASSLLSQQVGDLALAMEGPDGALMWPDAPLEGLWQLQRLGAPALRIAGGTDEVMRNILGERVLGLPREPRAV
jgi:acyl-CoA dehydrogenase